MNFWASVSTYLWKKTHLTKKFYSIPRRNKRIMWFLWSAVSLKINWLWCFFLCANLFGESSGFISFAALMSFQQLQRHSILTQSRTIQWWLSYACSSGEMLPFTDATKCSINRLYFVVTVLLFVLLQIHTAFSGNIIFNKPKNKLI